jgi:hypothetical protein
MGMILFFTKRPEHILAKEKDDSSLRSLKCYLQEVNTLLIYWFETLPKNLLFGLEKMYLIGQQMGMTGWNK